MKAAHRKLLVDLLTLPTSPFNERYVIDYIRRWVADRPEIRFETDAFGNLRLHLRRGGRRDRQPLLLSAHMDHPGFEAERMTGSRELEAIWRGGVPPEYFVGARVRFYTGGRWVRGKIRAITTRDDRGRQRVDRARVRVDGPVEPGSIGMWDFPDPDIRESRIYARGCDDIGGVAAILAALDELRKGRQPIDLYATLTRAEEVGFAGAIAGSQHGLIPHGARVVAIECSSALPGVRMGGGPILRVGDLSAIFTPRLTDFCRQVAADLEKTDKTFTYQRKLMDGGTCESAAFVELGFEATGLCVALGNYHNVDRERKRLGPEYIDLNDWSNLVKWFVALATTKREYGPGHTELRNRLKDLDRTYTPLLRKTVDRNLSLDRENEPSAGASRKTGRTARHSPARRRGAKR